MELASYTLVITLLVLLIMSFLIYIIKKDMVCTCKQTHQVDYFSSSTGGSDDNKLGDINSIKGKDWLDIISWKSLRDPITIDQSYRWYNTQ